MHQRAFVIRHAPSVGYGYLASLLGHRKDTGSRFFEFGRAPGARSASATPVRLPPGALIPPRDLLGKSRATAHEARERLSLHAISLALSLWTIA
jgi:hypothetical protein